MFSGVVGRFRLFVIETDAIFHQFKRLCEQVQRLKNIFPKDIRCQSCVDG